LLKLELNVVLDLTPLFELLHNIVRDRRMKLVLANRRLLLWVVLGTGHGDHAKQSSNGWFHFTKYAGEDLLLMFVAISK
jgi:hypothetical protein